MSSPTLSKPDIVAVIQNEGIELKHKGRAFWTCCPFHNEKTSSFKVDPDRQSFHCFGCNAHGDVIAYIQKTKAFTFPAALEYLGIDKGKTYRPDPIQVKKEYLYHAFEEWCRAYYIRLCDISRRLNLIKRKLTTEAEVDAYAWLYHQESTWELHMEILASNDLRAKLDLYKEVRHAA